MSSFETRIESVQSVVPCKPLPRCVCASYICTSNVYIKHTLILVLLKDVAALLRLVNASVSALKNSQSAVTGNVPIRNDVTPIPSIGTSNPVQRINWAAHQGPDKTASYPGSFYDSGSSNTKEMRYPGVGGASSMRPMRHSGGGPNPSNISLDCHELMKRKCVKE